jgi:lysophospholipase
MPLVVAIERTPNEIAIATNSSIFEFNPWEIGSYDATTYAYAPLQFIGTNFTAGAVSDTASCVVGFDNIGFVVGTSSSLFNQFYLQINATSARDSVKAAISNILNKYGEQNQDISVWPNPFFGFNSNVNVNAKSTILTLIDGGEDLQNIPFHPLLRPNRQVDVVFAIDGSADTSTRWPNGTSMVATYRRSQLDRNAVAFPTVPDQNSFINLGLNSRPTFFGCNATSEEASSPLIVYLPNAPYTYSANVSTFDLNFNDTERNSVIRNSFNMATMANSSVDRQWPACVACAVLFKSFIKTQTTPPDTCKQCFNKYCWNGTVNSTTPNTYNPTLIVKMSGGSNLKPIVSVFPIFLLLVVFHI